ncbi:sugar phosphate isomerase/epimerase family protein [Kribbella sp. CA-245084]|uniref:sugar phosphate isomerase/epimerase family protein n=1 Tax=Kribbella sp. CA-245084 TaxID=3239940 RepID=UPI003D8E6ABA
MTTIDGPQLHLGSCPDSWGIWFADDPQQTPWDRFLDELSGVGYQWIELGPYGYLPTDPARLTDELGKRGLRASGQAVGAPLHDRSQWEPTLAEARRVAELITAVGGKFLVILPGEYRDGKTGAVTSSRELDADSWNTLIRQNNELGRVIGEEYGLTLAFHPHADSHVETQIQVERFLHDTDPQYVSLCLDTGHLAYRHGDNVAIIEKYPERLGFLHIKGVDPDVLKVVDAEDLPFGEAVKRGVMAEPPNAEPKVEPIVRALEALDRDDLFVIVEQDLYPCEFDVPGPIARRTYDYLRSVGIGGDQS